MLGNAADSQGKSLRWDVSSGVKRMAALMKEKEGEERGFQVKQ
jgi:hypothetical protein